MTAKTVRNEERSFGVSVGSVLCLVAALLVWRGRPLRAELVGGIGALLIAAAILYAPILKYPSAAWWRFSRALGYVNARVLLTILYGIVLVPLSLIWRLTGTDPLGRRRDKWRGWTPYPPRYRDPKHYERMY